MELCGAAGGARPARPPFPARRHAAPAPVAVPHRPPPPRAARPAPRDDWRRRAQPPEDMDYTRVVQVTGFPPYTQPQDLAHAFSQFGCEAVWRAGAGAGVALRTADAARAALRASRAVNVYGHFLLVRPYLGPPEQQPTKSTKASTVDPSSIPWTGEFHEQLDALLSRVRLSPDAVQRLAALYRDLEIALQEAWPGCRAIPFGSVTTGLGVKSSDADCFMLVPGGGAGAVPRARRLLAQRPRTFAALLAIPRANTPIVKCFHLPTRTHCDVSFKTPLGAQNSKLISFLLHADPRLIPVAVTVKYYASVHELTGTGKLTNYALTMLIIFYLQQAPRSMLPPIEWLQRDRHNDFIVDGWNTGFMDNHACLPLIKCSESIAELLGGFFEYYASFNFAQLVVCPFLGRTIPKNAFMDLSLLPAEFERYKVNVLNGVSLPVRFNTPMCVQDPFEQCHNVASPVTSRLAADIQAYFKFAAEAYAQEKLIACRSFLKTILLEKPELPRGKGNPEFRVNLPSGLLANITFPDWKPVVRKIILLAFDTMLKANLKKAPETPTKTADKESARAKSAQEPKHKMENKKTADGDKEQNNPAAVQVSQNKPEQHAQKKEKPTPKREKKNANKDEKRPNSGAQESKVTMENKRDNPEIEKEQNNPTTTQASQNKEPEKRSAKKEKPTPKREKKNADKNVCVNSEALESKIKMENKQDATETVKERNNPSTESQNNESEEHVVIKEKPTSKREKKTADKDDKPANSESKLTTENKQTSETGKEQNNLTTAQASQNTEEEKRGAKKERSRPKREKEKYLGSFTRMVWKRKQIAKLFSVMELDFIDRERKITEEIVNFDKNEVAVEFQVVIAFRENPRSVVATVKYISGDMTHYREFGKFVLSTVQQWFVAMLKPHCTLKKRERVRKQKDKGEKREDVAAGPAAERGEGAASEDEEADGAAQLDDDSSDSDSVSSYEDERINPNDLPPGENSAGDATPPDANKENENASNSVDKTKHKNGNPVKNLSEEKPMNLQSCDKSDAPEVPGVTMNNDESDSNK